MTDTTESPEAVTKDITPAMAQPQNANVISLDAAQAITRMASDAGVHEIIPSLFAANLSQQQAAARISEAKEIKALCAACGDQESAQSLLATGASLDAVRAKLLTGMIERTQQTPIRSAIPQNHFDQNKPDAYGWGTAFAKARGNQTNVRA